MKSVIISIKPEWCEKIVRGQKTIEVRKSAPEKVPFKAYIYATRPKKYYKCGAVSTSDELLWLANGKVEMGYGFKFWTDGDEYQCLNGHVIGDFICDKVYSIKNQGNSFVVANEEQGVTNEIARQSCLDYDDMVGYLGNKNGYGWHISDLKIYDKPKEFVEFRKCGADSIKNLDDELCKYCEHTNRGEIKSYISSTGYHSCEGRWCEEAYQQYIKDNFSLTRPPQSYFYVEELEC